MSGREQIIANIRHSLGRSEGTAEQQVALLQHRSAAHRRHARPGLGSDLMAQFKAQMDKVQMTYTELPDLGALGEAVAAYLCDHELPQTLAVAPELDAVQWPEALECRTGAARADDLNSITACRCAIAETGSIVMTASAASPATLRFMPDNHMVVLRRDQLVAHFEDAWAVLRAEDQTPRAVHINTGPSRTGDVEQVIEIGAHGPRRMHVFLVD